VRRWAGPRATFAAFLRDRALRDFFVRDDFLVDVTVVVRRSDADVAVAAPAV
jgi:hypothetical protein